MDILEVRLETMLVLVEMSCCRRTLRGKGLELVVKGGEDRSRRIRP